MLSTLPLAPMTARQLQESVEGNFEWNPCASKKNVLYFHMFITKLLFRESQPPFLGEKNKWLLLPNVHFFLTYYIYWKCSNKRGHNTCFRSDLSSKLLTTSMLLYPHYFLKHLNGFYWDRSVKENLFSNQFTIETQTNGAWMIC